MRSLSVALAVALAVTACSSGGDSSSTTTPSPATSASAPEPSAELVKAVVNTGHTGCKPEVITDGCWLPLYARMSTEQGSAMNLGRQASTQCTPADTRDCWPQPKESVDVVCMATSEGEIWFGVIMTTDRVLTPDPDARRTFTGEKIGFARASMFRLDALPQVCPA